MKVNIVISDTEPTRKSWGLFWLDTSDNNTDSENDNVLRVYNDVEWLTVHFK